MVELRAILIWWIGLIAVPWPLGAAFVLYPSLPCGQDLRGFRMISSGFSFSDGEQILVSAQKPLGLVLEQDDETGTIYVASIDPNGAASQGGVQVGDILMAVQNASTQQVDLDDVLQFIGNGPRVLNLRLLRTSFQEE